MDKMVLTAKMELMVQTELMDKMVHRAFPVWMELMDKMVLTEQTELMV
jgi:hypothetical protein